MQRLRKQREGFALAVAIGAIVVIGALIAGVFFASTQQYRIGRNALLQARAEAAAEYGLNAIFDTTQTAHRWNVNWNNQTVWGVKDTMVFTSAGTVDSVFVTKVNQSNFFIVSEARVTGGHGAQARSRIGMLVPLRIPEVYMRAALTTRNSFTVGGSSRISGNDATVANWNCPPLDTALAGATVPDTNTVKCSGCKTSLSGNPPMGQDSIVGKDSTYLKFGDIGWDDLVAQAKVVPAGSSGSPAPTIAADGSCNMSDTYNWGDPELSLVNTACRTYFPIIHVQGDINLSGGVGQGILLVDGNLKATGGFHFYGLVVVKGNLDMTGSGGTFTGGVLAANMNGSGTSSLGNSTVQYSTCALKRAMGGSAQPIVGRTRSWIQLY